MRLSFEIMLVGVGVLIAVLVYGLLVRAIAEAILFPTPEAKAAGEQHDTEPSTARSAVPARRGSNHSPHEGLNLPAGSERLPGARIERESVSAAKPCRPAAGREQTL